MRPFVGLGATALLLLVGTGVVLRDWGPGVLPFVPAEAPGVPVPALTIALPVTCAPGVPTVDETSGVAVVPVGAGVTVTIFWSPTVSSFFPSHPLNTSTPATNPASASLEIPLLDSILSSIVAPQSGRAYSLTNVVALRKLFRCYAARRNCAILSLIAGVNVCRQVPTPGL